MNPYIHQQEAIFNEAVRLVNAGEDPSILAGKLDSEYAFRLRVHVQNMPEEARKKSIYGRAHSPTYIKKKK